MSVRILVVRTVILLASSPARAQGTAEITLFSQPNYRGQACTLRGSRESLNLHWVVRSVRVRGRDAWDVCTRTRFGTPRHRLSSSNPNIRWVVNSVRRIPRESQQGTVESPRRGGNAEFST